MFIYLFVEEFAKWRMNCVEWISNHEFDFIVIIIIIVSNIYSFFLFLNLWQNRKDRIWYAMLKHQSALLSVSFHKKGHIIKKNTKITRMGHVGLLCLKIWDHNLVGHLRWKARGLRLFRYLMGCVCVGWRFSKRAAVFGTAAPV